MNDNNVCCVNLKWYHFNQNNPGGSWDIDDKIDKNVFIQAHSHYEANGLAQDIGIYFDGVENGLDCRCCGNRWTHAYDEIDYLPLNGINVKIYPYGSIKN